MNSEIWTSLDDIVESSLRVPVELVKKTVGLGMDMGGSVFKIVYRSKENLYEANNTNNKMGHLQMVSFPKSNLLQGLDYVKERCEVRRADGPLPEIRTAGQGCDENGKIICEKLDARVKNIVAMECFVNAFRYLVSYLARKEFLHPYDDEAAVEPVESMKDQMSALVDMLKSDPNMSKEMGVSAATCEFSDCLGKIVNESDEPIEDSEAIYPCILAICGSRIGHLLLQKDGTYKIIDMSKRGGRALYGMGCLLTGCTTFDELIELASKGNPRNVDVYSDSVFQDRNFANGEDSMYSHVADLDQSTPMLVYCFGKGVAAKLKDFRREDLARAWLNYVASDMVHGLLLNCHAHGVRRIFMSGSMCNTSLMRSIFTAEMVRRNLNQMIFGQNSKAVSFDFIKAGPYLGALGALLSEAGVEGTFDILSSRYFHLFKTTF